MPNISYTPEELTCRPLDSYSELIMFVKDPPPWRSLCKELTPHSDFKINNIEVHKHDDIYLDAPETFCHINPDEDDPPRTEKTKLPKTLVCHDMANGYHDDSFVDGTGNRNAYTFYNWAGIDIFCYFSHHLVTIPPVSWINTAHAHGVKVIGTLITEWNEGVSFWDEVLESEMMFQNTASALVAIAKCLKFDGWLLNVENKITKPKLLLEFVQHLRYLLHQEIPHAELIWYDSVTIDGHLNWQNGLNEKNRAFFDACDGIFTNYSWTEFDITTSAVEAGDRITDLYIGIDVWGRNFFGGGQLNTQAAVKVAYEEGCSLAIFAPAWTHEAMSEEKDDPNYVLMAEGLDRAQRWLLRDRALWGSLWPYLTTRLPSQLPFQTSFCRGLGKKRRTYGEVLCRGSWFNLRHQQYQPNAAHGPHGYLVSTDEVVHRVSTHGMYKDTKGILRVRHSFQASRLELFCLKPRIKEEAEASEEPDAAEKKREVQLPMIERNSIQRRSIELGEPDREAEGEADSSEPPSVPVAERRSVMRLRSPEKKRSMIDNLKKFFGIKSKSQSDRRRVLVAEEQARGSREPSADAGRSSSAALSSGRSMVAMSVNLRLGQAAAGPRAAIALTAVPQERECLQVELNDSFNGGSCLRVHPSDEVCTEHRYTRLFHCDFTIREALVVCVVTKQLLDYENQYLTVRLHTVSPGGSGTRVALVGRSVAQTPHAGWTAAAGGVLTLMPLDPAGARFCALRRYLLLHETGFYVPRENDFGWTVRYYEITELAGSRVTSVNLRTGSERGPVLLGHFGLCHKPLESPGAGAARASPASSVASHVIQ